MPYKLKEDKKKYEEKYRQSHKNEINKKSKKRYREKNKISEWLRMKESLSEEEYKKWEKEKQIEKQKKYYQLNKEKFKKYWEKYRLLHRDDINKKQKERYREKNGTPKWLKIKEFLSQEEYKKWQKEKRNRYKRNIGKRNKEFIDNYKKNNPCKKCGEKNIFCLEFHHRDQDKKSFDISKKGTKTNLFLLENEILKCDILCKNCHIKLHFQDKRMDSYKLSCRIKEIEEKYSITQDKKEKHKLTHKKQLYKNKKYVSEYKMNGKCEICNMDDFICFVFHHKDPSTKRGSIPSLVKYGFKSVQEEIKKCQLLCHNCHSKIHNDTKSDNIFL